MAFPKWGEEGFLAAPPLIKYDEITQIFSLKLLQYHLPFND